ncbi:MAG: metal ABC transporter permease [Synergistaceae bacterium]|nr:metal ABC transporter permease [Synergistaceae bacterium]
MTWSDFLEIVSYPFVVRALVAGCLISLCASMLGVILVLKRYALIGHGLSEVGFAALAVALALDLSPLYVAMPLVVAASFGIMLIGRSKRVNGDVAIGVASSAALAAGVIVTSVTRGANTDVWNYMFGSVLAMTNEEVALSVALSIFIVVLFVLFYNRLFLVTYSEDCARSLGVNVEAYQFAISALTALTVVLGMRMMGTLLISSLVIMPALTARRLVGSFRALVVAAAVISPACFCGGLAASLFLNIPTGASVVAVNLAAMFLAGIPAIILRNTQR